MGVWETGTGFKERVVHKQGEEKGGRRKDLTPFLANWNKEGLFSGVKNGNRRKKRLPVDRTVRIHIRKAVQYK